jgi:hypothetical protein
LEGLVKKLYSRNRRITYRKIREEILFEHNM